MSESCGCGCEHEHSKIIVPVQGMMCEHCEAKVEKALNAIPGVHATANHELGCVTLLLHDKNDADKCRKVIADLGYTL